MVQTPIPASKRKRPINWFQKFSSRYVWVIWVLIFVALIVGLFSGIYGFSLSDKLVNPDSGTVEMPDAVYATLKLLKLGDHTSFPTANGWITLSRFLLPLCVSLAAILGLFTALRRCYHRACAYGFKKHTIICGLGDRGVSYIKDAVNGYIGREREKLNIIVIEKDPNNPGVKYCHDEGIPVFIGDATKPDVLVLARPWRAKEIFAFFPNDGKNLALANTLADVYHTMKVHRTDNVKCYLSITNVALHSQFTDHVFAFRDNNEKIDLPITIEFCYSHEYLAERAIIQGIGSLIVRGIETNKFDRHTTPEIAILGAGYRGRKIIANIARLFHLTNEVQIYQDENGCSPEDNERVEYHIPVKLHVYDKDEKAAENLYNEYPILEVNKEGKIIPFSANDELLNLHKHLNKGKSISHLPLPELEFETIDLDQPQNVAKIAYDLYTNKNIKSIIIALGTDSSSIAFALQLERIFDTYSSSGKPGLYPQIVVYYEKYGGFDTVFGNSELNHLSLENLKKTEESKEETSGTKIIPLCNWSTVSFDKDMTTDGIDQIAIGVDACYSRHHSKDMPKNTQPILADLTESEFSLAKQRFEKLSVMQINQNRDQVLHNQIKLNLIGYSTTGEDRPLPSGFEYIDNWDEIIRALKENADWLCRLEHQRWWAEQLMGGGHYANIRDNALELHPDMAPFEYIHDVPSAFFGVNCVRTPWSESQMNNYNALLDMVLSFKYAGYLPIRKIGRNKDDLQHKTA